MYGLLIENVVEFIKFKYGERTWLQIWDKAKIHEYTFVTHKMYSEKVIPKLAKAVYEVTGDGVEEFMRETGYDFVLFLSKYGYDRMLRVLGRSMRDFLNGLDNLHEYLRFSYPKMKPPSFFCTDESAYGLTLHYRTNRKGYTQYVEGQLMRVGKMFYNLEVRVKILEESELEDDLWMVRFKLYFDNQEFVRAHETQDRDGDNVHSHIEKIPPEILFELFPFHLRFNGDLTITGVGTGLHAVMPDLVSRNLAQAFELKKPHVQFNWESIRSRDNCVFDMESTNIIIRNLENLKGVSEGNTAVQDQPLRAVRNAINTGSDSDSEGEPLEDVFQPRRMRLKGQMVYVSTWNSVIFLSTPTLPNLDAMFATGLFINDLSMHDSSRDLVLAGTQQSSELQLALDQEMQKSKELESSMRKLDQEMKRTDTLLYQMIPRQVADKLRRGEPATNTCEVFKSVSILFSDVVGFTSICSRITPMEVVSMLNGMYTLFDNLSEEYKVYKVETIGDAYMIVAGAPVKTNMHAVRVVEMAQAMLKAIVTLSDPHSGNPMTIRVGIHSGMVVAGVVGLKMPRYCLFGDTVNTASRMESTGESLKIHLSEVTKKNLDKYPGYILEERDTVEVKGKGSMKTFWLTGKEPSCPDYMATVEEEDSDGSDVLSRCNSSISNIVRRDGYMLGDNSRRGSRSSIYTPVSFEEISRSSSPVIPEEFKKMPAGGGCPLGNSLKDKTNNLKPGKKPRPPPAANKSNGAQQKQTHNFGQKDYGHANMQSFMDPAHAHGKMDGASHPPSHDAPTEKQRHYSASRELQNSSDSNSHVNTRQMPLVTEQHQEKEPAGTTPTTDSRTNTNTGQVPHSSACKIL